MMREANEAAGQEAGPELAGKAVSESEQQRMLREAAEAMRQAETDAHADLGSSAEIPWRPIVAGLVGLALLALLWATFAGRDRSESPSAVALAEESTADISPTAAETAPLADAAALGDPVAEIPPGGASDSSEVSPDPQPDLPPPPPPLEEVEPTLHEWAASWADQRVDDYLAHYAAEFSPPQGRSRADWEANRHDRIGRPEWIRVTLGAVENSSAEDGRAIATFEQTYESPNYEDRVQKTVEMVWEDGRWMILSETSSPLG